jgi:ubiquinone/menaquinone biosynthesis C-methylase UbiE
MAMTQASAEYFERVAGDWDAIRTGYFGEEVRQAAIERAYLRPEHEVADVGAGTGFVAAGLAPLVRRVHALDGSAAMLDEARRNLVGFENIEYHVADGAALPLPDGSVDAVFANMYLHHCTDPLGAIREMARLLRPGGRLVISDMDAHPYAWLKAEMTDVWQGFERPQVKEWLEQAGLVNTYVDCSGQSCCAESQDAAVNEAQGGAAHISIFLAVGTKAWEGVHEAVQADYTRRITEGAGSCCGGDSGLIQLSAPGETAAPVPQQSCCGGEGVIDLEKLVEQGDFLFKPRYAADDLAQAPAEAAEIPFGCGTPLEAARPQPGETLVDIGSGGGLEVFLAARQVGEQGRAIGVDMTPAMLERARRSAQKAGLSQVEFRQGTAEALPVEAGSVDVIISNCVINLAHDKGKAFSEAFRTLKDGGRLAISDMVTSGAIPRDIQANLAVWAECVSGALPEREYVDLVKAAGFRQVQVQRSREAVEALGVKVYSITLTAVKGGETGCCG